MKNEELGMKNYEYRTENSIKLLYHAEILHSSFSVLKLKKAVGL